MCVFLRVFVCTWHRVWDGRLAILVIPSQLTRNHGTTLIAPSIFSLGPHWWGLRRADNVWCCLLLLSLHGAAQDAANKINTLTCSEEDRFRHCGRLCLSLSYNWMFHVDDYIWDWELKQASVFLKHKYEPNFEQLCRLYETTYCCFEDISRIFKRLFYPAGMKNIPPAA